MKNSTFLRSFGFPGNNDYVMSREENGFKLDFSKGKSLEKNYSATLGNSKSQGLTSIILLFILFLFSNFLFAQSSPACNLKGPLKAKFSKSGGDIVTISSESINLVNGSVYVWSFKTNTAGATFASENGLSSIKVKSGTKGGSYTLQLKIVNPLPPTPANPSMTQSAQNAALSNVSKKNNTCTCTQSISVNTI